MKPTTTRCPVCLAEFQQPQRKQGGGKRTIYCSAKCRSKDWVRGNGAKRRAAIVKYESRPVNKERKRQRTRAATLARYGLTEATFGAQLLYQAYMCLGCRCKIDKTTARIDHCHRTNQVRGLLCDHCNWSLGHAKDNPVILRALAEYLEENG